MRSSYKAVSAKDSSVHLFLLQFVKLKKRYFWDSPLYWNFSRHFSPNVMFYCNWNNKRCRLYRYSSFRELFSFADLCDSFKFAGVSTTFSFESVSFPAARSTPSPNPTLNTWFDSKMENGPFHSDSGNTENSNRYFRLNGKRPRSSCKAPLIVLVSFPVK